MTHVAFVTDCLALGGTELHSAELILRAKRVATTILCLGPDVYTPLLRERGRTDVPVRLVRPRTFTAYARAFARLRPDVIVFVNGKLGLFPWWAYAAARIAGRARVVGIEHLQAERPPAPVAGGGIAAAIRRRLGWQARYMLARRVTGLLSRPTICVSEAVRRTIIRDYGYPASRTVTIHNGVDVNHHRRTPGAREAVRASLGITEDTPVLVYVARLAPLKRVDLLLEAVARVHQNGPPCHAIVVGDGPLATTLAARASALGLDKTVHFVGRQADVRPYLDAADVYVTSSEREGLCLAVVEGMAHELPCVATDIGGHDEILLDRSAGLLVPSGDAEELARGICTIVERPEAHRAMGQAARRVVEERFNIDRMVTEIWRMLLGAGR